MDRMCMVPVVLHWQLCMLSCRTHAGMTWYLILDDMLSDCLLRHMPLQVLVEASYSDDIYTPPLSPYNDTVLHMKSVPGDLPQAHLQIKKEHAPATTVLVKPIGLYHLR